VRISSPYCPGKWKQLRVFQEEALFSEGHQHKCRHKLQLFIVTDDCLLLATLRLVHHLAQLFDSQNTMLDSSTLQTFVQSETAKKKHMLGTQYVLFNVISQPQSLGQ